MRLNLYIEVNDHDVKDNYKSDDDMFQTLKERLAAVPDDTGGETNFELLWMYCPDDD